MSDQKQGDVDRFLKTDGLDSEREKEIGQHIGYRYDVNLVPDHARLTPFLEPEGLALPDNQQDRDMIARELLIKFQMSERHPMVQLNKAYRKF
jgi:hypothetical protein